MRVYNHASTVREVNCAPKSCNEFKKKKCFFPFGKRGSDRRKSNSLNLDVESCSRTKATT